jgi:predicted nucleic acid-binding Zn ribbon protein
MTRPRSSLSKPVHIGELLPGMVAGMRKDRDAAMMEVFDRWEALVGPVIAANSLPVGFKGPLLLVHVADSVWMQQLQFLKPELMARINAGLTQTQVSEIRFKIGPVCAP